MDRKILEDEGWKIIFLINSFINTNIKILIIFRLIQWIKKKIENLKLQSLF
jgi:hypothetical protein